jgi:hypothetical protein
MPPGCAVGCWEQALARREPARRYPILLTVVIRSAVDALLLFDQALSGREERTRIER